MRSGWIRDETRTAIYLRDGGRCVYCLAEAEMADLPLSGLTLEHLRGRGDNSPGALVTACRACNSARPLRDLDRFAARRGLDAGEIRARIHAWPRRRLAACRRLAVDGLRLCRLLRAAERRARADRVAAGIEIDPWEDPVYAQEAAGGDVGAPYREARAAVAAEILAAQWREAGRIAAVPRARAEKAKKMEDR